MTPVVALKGASGADPVDRVARGLAAALGSDSVCSCTDPERGWEPGDVCVMARGDPSVSWLALAQSLRQPLVVVPSGVPEEYAVRRVLVPLDGTAESASAVRQTVDLLAGEGVEIIVLHVFHAKNVPHFWDQASHAERDWSEEFKARFCREHEVQLVLRAGTPGDRLLDAAVDERADLVVLGWSQRHSGGHAATVRGAVAETAVPIMLVPVAQASGPSALSSPPKAAIS
jgi:nucleotide-binding universal stress UspA family protein